MLPIAVLIALSTQRGSTMTCKSTLPVPEHREAVRLAWSSLHIPIGSILLGFLLLSGIISATSMVWGYGPVNPIP